jgi:hypothetical protein
MAALNIEQILSRADTLARQTAAARVPDEQLSVVLSHLKRHRDVAATLTLLGELRQSPFAHRTRSTPAQLTNLDKTVRSALAGLTAWEDAAAILGWARRLVVFYAQGQTRSQGGDPQWR